jgi:ketosteroid isomerase-like protein
MSSHVESIIQQLEAERGRALVASDYEALENLLTEDLVHIHATGIIDGKQSYLDGIRANLTFLDVSRPALDIRSEGNIAVATGTLRQSVRIKAQDVVIDMLAAVTQVWRLESDHWRICSFQATNMPRSS